MPEGAQARRRSRSRTSASTSTRASTTRASSAPRSRTRPAQDRAGRLDADDAARPQPLHADDTRARHRGLQAQDPRGASSRSELEDEHSKKWVLGKYLNTRAVRHRRRPDGDRRRRGRAAVLRQARQGPDAARGRDARRHAAGAVAVLAGATTRRDQGAPQRGAGQDGRARDDHAASAAQGEMAKGLGLHMDGYFAQRPRALRARLRQVRADQGVRRRDACCAAASASTRRSTSSSSARRATRSPTTWPASGRRRRSSRSTPRTATSSRWRPRSLRPLRASRSSTSPPRATASPAPRSRSWR